jgi:predicted dehydrogenase
MAGLGFMGATHLAAYAKIPSVKVVGISTQSNRSLADHLTNAGGNLNRPATQFDFTGVRQVAHWRELVLDSECDVIDICLPTDLHADVAITALAAGKHVLCEKPMALTTTDCERMMKAAQENDRVLMIAHVLRFWPEYDVLRDFVQSNRRTIRSARFVRTAGLPDWSNWLPVESRSGGAVLDLSVHDIDQALRLFGFPERITAAPLGDIDAVQAVFDYPEGLNVQIEGGWFAPKTPFFMSFNARADHSLLELTREGLFLEGKKGRNKISPPAGDAYDAQIAYFVECCRVNKQPDRCPPEQSAEAVKLALLVKESRAKGGESIKCLV